VDGVRSELFSCLFVLRDGITPGMQHTKRLQNKMQYLMPVDCASLPVVWNATFIERVASRGGWGEKGLG
jgi:hypothetical protein